MNQQTSQITEPLSRLENITVWGLCLAGTALYIAGGYAINKYSGISSYVTIPTLMVAPLVVGIAAGKYVKDVTSNSPNI